MDCIHGTFWAPRSLLVTTAATWVVKACWQRPNAPQVKLVGKQRLVLDLSCRQRDGQYYVVTDRWQRFSELALSEVGRLVGRLGMGSVTHSQVCAERESCRLHAY
jgi:hypothetical protein